MSKSHRWTRELSTRRMIQARRPQRQRLQKRRLLVEGLESRQLMAADTYYDSLGNRLGFIPLPPPLTTEQQAPPGGGSGGSGNASVDPPLSDTFKLHSRPSATKTIYLDFDGFTARGTSWNRSRGRDPIISPPYSKDANEAFSDSELRDIQTIWQRVAGDFAVFDVNVTTEDPGEEDLVNTGGSDNRWGIRVVFTPDDFPAPGAGGVAYINSFSWGYESAGATDTPCYVFNIYPPHAALAASHEVGHSLGLSHDGTDGTNPFQQNAAYYFGHGGTGETSWGPIMGAPYDRNVTHWDNGFYLGSNNGGANANYGSGGDDLAIITSSGNGFGFIPDQHGGTRDTASELKGPINAASRNEISLIGLIERASDQDFFRFQAGVGTLDLTIDPYVTKVFTSKAGGSFDESIANGLLDSGYWPNTQTANLDVEATLYDSSGTVIATSNPNGLRAEFRGLALTGGIYYLRIDGVGFGDPRANPPTGWSDYGSIGQYLISGSYPVAFGISVVDSSIEYVENSLPVPVAPTAKVVDQLPGGYASATLVTEIVPGKGPTDFLTLNFASAPGLSQVGSLMFYNDVQVASFRRISDASFQITFTDAATSPVIELITRSIRFEARGDAPSTSARSVVITLTKGIFIGSTNIDIEVVAVNDAPIALAVSMDPINEDSASPNGNTVAQIADRGVIDPDLTQAAGIILTGVAAGTGKWQYSAGTTWRDLPAVAPEAGLVLRSTSRLRFVPAPDFFGNAPALRYYALDDNYRGGFSTSTTPVFANVASIVEPSSISASNAEIRQVVRPVNDAPVASTPFPRTSVFQDALLTFTVPSTLFSDIDDTVLTWSARSSTGGSLPQWISFDSASRTFTGTPRNEDVGQQLFMVRATDAEGLFAEAPFTVDVINVNDAPRDIRLVGQPVPENILGARIGRLTAIDPDPNDSLTWAVIDNKFEVRGNELYLLSQFSFDFESEKTVEVIVRAIDNGTPRLFFETVITVSVSDVNEFAPRLTPISLSIPENASGGTVIGQASAIDGDTANQVKYRFFGAPPSQFLLDATTGNISLKPGVTLDYETTPSYTFYVEAYDDGIPSLSTWVSTIVSVENINEFSPTISTTSITVAENHPIGLPFGRILATDRDKQAIVFSLPPDENRFSIDPATGNLSLNSTGALDFERSRTETLRVIATDDGTPSLFSERQIVLQVTNANEPPTAVSVPVTQVLANISGLNLGRITVQDPDGPTQYDITPLDSRFQVVGGNLVFKAGQSFRDSDPRFIQVPMLLNDSAGGISSQLEIQLERLLNPNPWQNTVSPFDVNRSGSVDPLDVLAVINAINGNSNPNLPIPRDQSSLGNGDVDVDGDGKVTPLDVLAVVNRINNNQNRGEGEAPLRETSSAVDNYFAQYDLEFDPLVTRSRRLRR